MHPRLARAQLLLEQSRPRQAADEFRQYLLDNPNDPIAHAQLSICLAQTKQFASALEHAQTAIGQAPDSSAGHFAAAYCWFMRDRPRQARTAVNQAISIAGPAPHLLQLRGSISLMEKNWNEALEDANAGLQLAPEDESLLNVRARALIGLGRRMDASESLDLALQRDPENAYSHANQGWILVERGQYERAMEHFREALRLDPGMEWARQGIVHAMKAKFFLYRIFLTYILWMARLKGRYQIALVASAYLLVRWIGSAAQNHPQLAPWLTPILFAYIGFVMLSWMAVPFFNLLLRTSRFGRLALSPDETRGANLLAGAVVVFLGLLVAALVTGSPRFEVLAVHYGLLLIPVSSIYQVAGGKFRWMVSAATLALVVIGTVPLLPGLAEVVDGNLFIPRWANGWSSLFTYGILGITITANFMPVEH